MFINKKTSLITFGDFIDLYLKIKEKGFKAIFFKLTKLNYSDKVSSKWDNYVNESDFWVIPEIRNHWNKTISGNENVSYEEYVSKKYFSDKKKISLLSIGCGEGLHERNFCEYLHFQNVIGIDISNESIKIAKNKSEEENKKITYISSDFSKVDFKNEKFDIILFDSSLHHFEKINTFLRNNIKPILNENGVLVVFEYCGPNRLQWKNNQIKKCNDILKKLPKKFKKFQKINYIKKKVYRPGILRMFAVDPSEAPDSENLQSALHNNFDILEEKKLGWNVIQPLFKGIAHNFLNKKKETKDLIKYIVNEEENFLEENNIKSDAIFGVYKLKN
ncbi:class I SAM-dependent methyltransferase [Flavobacterium jejuense]|uniref:Class I SAM-dependent methyltransferase n=1 Tax=Flavobacterium jejuense TaxID=1544455 RepID=A0ABX0IUI6_9FLAO|nr:class I SAM-dependent methyltransferase [Flavobacterium jejuense]NHN27569.1 class I SAM-dependent methyltransferase [Flavobacterium jejuense]